MQTYLRLTDYSNKVLSAPGAAETAIPVNNNSPFDAKHTQFIEVTDFSADVEQTLNIGSQTAGAGAGKITFNPLQITKHVDAFSSILFQRAAAGTPFKTAEIFFVGGQNVIQMTQIYKLAAVKTVKWASSDSGVVETVTFEYGGLYMIVNIPGADGTNKFVSQGGWNRIRNVIDSDANSELKIV